MRWPKPTEKQIMLIAVAVAGVAILLRLAYGRGWMWRMMPGEGFQDAAAAAVAAPPPAEPPAVPAAPPPAEKLALEPAVPPVPAVMPELVAKPAAEPMPKPAAEPVPEPAAKPPMPLNPTNLSFKVLGLKDQFDALQKVFIAEMSLSNLKSVEDTLNEMRAAASPENKDEQALLVMAQTTLATDKKQMRAALGPVEGFKEYTGNPYTPMSPNSYQALQFRLGSPPPRPF